MRRALVILLFVLSGAAALAYQVAWTRHLVLVFGNTTRAVSLILAAYMLGLALGSEAGGRLADRAKRPVLWYAGFEGAIGAFAFLFPLLVHGVRSAYLSLGTAAAPVLFVGAFLVLLVPTFLMGTTLPLLVRAVVRDPRRTGSDVGLLYGANIVGAVAGTAVTGFWLIEAAGVIGSTYWAGGVNFLIGALGLLVPFVPEGRAAGPEPVPESGPTPPRAGTGRVARAALVAAFAGGLVGLAAEVVWTRLLVFFLQGFTYTFSAMLATFLLGLALGGFVFGRLSTRVARPALLMGRLQVAVGVAAAGVLLLLTYHFEWTRALWTAVGDDLGVVELRPRHVVTLLLSSATALLLPAFLMGGVFPLASMAYQRGLGDLGARIGRLYAVNTIGAVLGSLIAGFVLAPWLGMTWAAAVVAIAAVVAGGAVLWLVDDRPARAVLWVGGAAAAAGLLLVAADPSRPMLSRSHVFSGTSGRENRLLETREGTVCQVSVVENERERYHLLYTDEFQAAGTKPEYRYMRMLAHLPIALADDPSRVLVICWGTGTTAGSTSTHEIVERLDIVEISPQVLEVAAYFEHVNRGVLRGAGRDDLEVVPHVDDGRNFVLRSRDQWGVISLEPLMPYTPAAIHFYTEDFYRECAPRLAPGGVMCQWIPLQGLSRAHLRQLVSAFVRVYPGAVMFHVDGAVALIGGNEPVVLDHARVARRLGAPEVRSDLAAIGYDDPVRALGTFVAGGDELAAFGDVEPMTDEHPVLEFHPIPLSVQLKHLWENLGAMRELRESYGSLPVALPADDGELQDGYLLVRDIGNLVLEGSHRLEEAGLLARLGRKQAAVEAMSGARQALAQAVALDPDDPAARRMYDSLEREWHTIVALGALDRGELEEAETALLQAALHPALRQADVVPTRLAEVRNRAERFEEALEAATEATRLFPRGLEARAERAYARSSLGDNEGAARDYRRALLGAPPASLEDVRLRADAERVLAVQHAAEPRPLPDRIEAALAGEGLARVRAPLVLRVLSADHPERFAAHFADDLARLAEPTGDAADRMLSLKRVQLAAPAGAADVALAVARSGSPERLAAAAARAVAELEPGRLADLLAPDTPLPALEAAIASAATAATAYDDAVVDRLIALLSDARPGVRQGAKRALFSLSDGRCTAVAALDVDAHPAEAYTESVELVRDWWRRQRDLRALRPR